MKLTRLVVPTLVLSLAGLVGSAASMADDQHQGDRAAPQSGHAAGGHPAGGHAAAPARGEHYAGPQRYQRVQAPKGWNARPQKADPRTYNHNFQASRSYHIGPYRPPVGWAARRWAYGQILPRAYWASEYLVTDYWLFSLEVPPAGYEWVRDGADALMISMVNGQILQAEYGVFG